MTKFKRQILTEEAKELQKRGFTLKEIEALLESAISSKTASSIARELQMDEGLLSRLKEREGSAALVEDFQGRFILQVNEALSDDPEYLIQVRDEIVGWSPVVVLGVLKAVKSEFERATQERPRLDLVLLLQALEEKVISSYSFKNSSQGVMCGITRDRFLASIKEIVNETN
jgi:hypothetical protein